MNLYTLLQTNDIETVKDCVMARYATDLRYSPYYHFTEIYGPGTVWSTAVATAATNGYKSWVNPYWMAENCKDLDEACGVFCHEAIHGILDHLPRISEVNLSARDGNIPADWVDNIILRADGIRLPEGALFHPEVTEESSFYDAVARLLASPPPP